MVDDFSIYISESQGGNLSKLCFFSDGDVDVNGQQVYTDDNLLCRYDELTMDGMK